MESQPQLFSFEKYFIHNNMPIRVVNKNRFIFLIIIVLAIVGILVYFGTRLSKNESGKESANVNSEERVYEAMVQPFDQESDDSNKTNDSSLKKGDVIVIFPEGHSWSESEKTSYLILKMKLTEGDANKLVEPVRKEVEQRGDEKDKEPRSETVKARKYRVNIESLNFDLQNFWENPIQPYSNQVFDSGMIEQKT